MSATTSTKYDEAEFVHSEKHKMKQFKFKEYYRGVRSYTVDAHSKEQALHFFDGTNCNRGFVTETSNEQTTESEFILDELGNQYKER